MQFAIKLIKEKYEKIKFINNKYTFFSFLVLNLALCFVYAITDFGFVIPVVNIIIFALSMFFVNAKYRVYCLLFFAPFIKLLTIKELNIGSFYSYILLFYDALILMPAFIKRKISFKTLFVVVFFAIYVVVISIVGGGLAGFVKSVSFLGYIFSILAFENDTYARKDITYLILSLLCGLILSNALACFVIYFMGRDIAINFLNSFISPTYAKFFAANNGSFRYPGLAGDPNFLGLYTLFLTAIIIVFYRKLHFKPLILFLTIFLQFFSFLGLSKSYILVLVVMLFFVLYYFFRKKKKLLHVLVPILVVIVFSLFIVQPSFFQSLMNRFLFLDTRNGFLYAFTTQRSSIQFIYCSNLLSNPLRLLFGSGVSGEELFKNAHNFYIMLIWDFGIVGVALYISYCSLFLKLKYLIINKFLFLPLIVLFVYGFSLDFVLYAEIIYFSYFIFSNYRNDFVDSFKVSEVSI